jgi:hypothetical protein
VSLNPSAIKVHNIQQGFSIGNLRSAPSAECQAKIILCKTSKTV